MKLICKDNRDIEKELTVGVEYDILVSIGDESVTVINNFDKEFVAHQSRFYLEGEKQEV